ncbi:MAG TPA: SAM-dependent methyltransferase [Solirubrobacterales bacterium]|nr:SAM-dependent methyltransferase [Solirubrobacterales bacterium]
MDRETDRPASVTALGNLALACLAATERDPGVRIDDPISPRLLRWSDGSAGAARLTVLHPLLRAATNRLIPGIYGYALARAHHMDQVLRKELAAGLDSVVILGAGYDTRAYRMRNEVADVLVFEVDHPATSRDKRRRLASATGSTWPTNITFIEADLTEPDLPEQLARHGHDPSMRTLFLLSGVSMYLPAGAMASLLDQVSTQADARTSLLFDYLHAEALVEPDRYFGKEWLVRAAKVGEKPQWGIPAGEAGALLRSHGLNLDADLGANELRARYLQRVDGSSAARPFDFGAVAQAFGSQSD